MKKTITSIFCGAALVGGLFAQSQRLQLIEEITGEKCGPCAAVNPSFNALLNSGTNPSKILAIKYQAPHGGNPPYVLYSGVAKTDADARMTYYANNAAPNGYQDGNAWNGNPYNFTQTMIDNRSSVTSPFDINVSHTISSDYDSIYVTVTITATQAVSTTSSMKGHVVVIEDLISFDTPPGTNGEKDFEEVMRKMLPTANGTTLPSSWTVGQSQTINVGWKFQDIYDYSEVAVVAFVQDNADKQIHQAAKSEPLPITFMDAKLASISNVQAFSCGSSITPSVVLTNNGNTTLTSVTIYSTIDNQTPLAYPWTGSLAPGASATVSLSAMSVTQGTHTLEVYNDQANGSADYNTSNSKTQKEFTIASSAVSAPVVETFTSTTFPPVGWSVDDKGSDAITWARHNSGHAKMDIYNSPAGQEDDFITTTFDLSPYGNWITLEFDVAYAQYQSENDELEVLVSGDCGSTWTSVFSKTGSDLSTATATQSSFTPNSSQWRKEIIDISSFAGNANVVAKFHVLSDYGNNLYIDSVNIFGPPLNLNENSQNNINTQVYPNPNAGIFNVVISSREIINYSIVVKNTLGQVVSSDNVVVNGVSVSTLDISRLSKGIYFVTVDGANNPSTFKVIVK